MTSPPGSDDREADRPRETARPDGATGAPTTGPIAGRPRRHLLRALLAIALAVVATDLATKQVAIDALAGGERVELLGELLSLRLVYNPGAAFSLAAGTTWLFTVIAVVVVVVILRVARRLGSTAWAVALGLLLGGATGNLLDRLFRPPGFGIGHVVDFIDYAGFFVGNVADVGIVVAAGLIMLLTIRGVGVDGSVHRSAADDD
jgi:signal peptidase II